jgi:heme A synthase
LVIPAADVSAPAAPITGRARLFTGYAWAVLGWNLLVVLWGAYVRASGSGAGCGDRWPLCNGEIAPRFPRLATVIEFVHRASSGIALVAVLGLLVWSLLAYPRRHRVRRAAIWSFVFLILEALLGAGLVLFDYVDKNVSIGRAVYLSMHLVNTQLLLGALALTAWFSRRPASRIHPPLGVVLSALPVAVLISMTGVIAALADTLFPAASLAEGMRQDVAATANFLVHWRVIHPAVAVAGALFIIWAATAALRRSARPTPRRMALLAAGTAVAQLIAGAVNLALLTPAGMQLLHLFIADLLWILLVLLAVEAPESSGRAQPA